MKEAIEHITHLITGKLSRLHVFTEQNKSNHLGILPRVSCEGLEQRTLSHLTSVVSFLQSGQYLKINE